jgi:hypothetical protein
MQPALGGSAVGVGATAVVMAVDAVLGLGVGWQWYYGVVGIVVLGLLLLPAVQGLAESARPVAKAAELQFAELCTDAAGLDAPATRGH